MLIQVLDVKPLEQLMKRISKEANTSQSTNHSIKSYTCVTLLITVLAVSGQNLNRALEATQKF